MKSRNLFVTAILGSLGLGNIANGQITVDGTLDAAYGPPIAVQTVETNFGDAAPPGSLGGSELNAAYAHIAGGRLYLLLTGNHEPNFNKLEVFIDSKPGGENVVSATPEYDFFNGGNWISTNMQGLTFDTGFELDYHLFSRWGGGGVNPYEADFIDRNGGGSAMVPGASGTTAAPLSLQASGSILAGSTGPNASGSSLTQNLDFAIDNNNAAGVLGGTLASDPVAAAAVTTGMEFSIALADLGNPGPGSTIKICAAINNGDHNYLSNQFLGGLAAPQGNLGGDGGGGFIGTLSGVNLNQFLGQQYFEITVPGGQSPQLVSARPYHETFPGPDGPAKVDTSVSMILRGPAVQSATLSNVISSTQGINGVVLDFDQLNALGDISLEYKMSPPNVFADPITSWPDAPPPASTELLADAGEAGSDRVLIKWTSGSIANRYLCIKVIYAGSTIAELYLGHLRGEMTGDSGGKFTVLVGDILAVRTDLTQAKTASGRTDVDKSGTVLVQDILDTRSNLAKELTQLSVPALP
jgi:hypothetical protein